MFARWRWALNNDRPNIWRASHSARRRQSRKTASCFSKAAPSPFTSAEKSEKLLPRDRIARERATAWVFAALNSIEIWVLQLAIIDFFHAKEEWTKERRPQVEKLVRDRLGQLENALGEKDYLEGQFTVGDLMMADVLRILDHTDMLKDYPRLNAYKQRCTARPAFQRAMKAQLEGFKKAA